MNNKQRRKNLVSKEISMTIHKHKVVFTLIIFLGFVTVLKAQKTDFEGQITYKSNTISKSKEVSEETLDAYFGDTIITIIKRGNYRQKYLNAVGITDVIYLASDNNWYYKMYGIDTLYFLDCSKEGTELVGTHKSDSVVSILGYKCKSFSITTSSNKGTFYYADSLYINPSYFSKHLLYFYNIYAEETESVYLKCIVENKVYVSAMTAVKIEKKDIEDSVFILPKLPKVKK